MINRYIAEGVNPINPAMRTRPLSYVRVCHVPVCPPLDQLKAPLSDPHQSRLDIGRATLVRKSLYVHEPSPSMVDTLVRGAAGISRF